MARTKTRIRDKVGTEEMVLNALFSLREQKGSPKFEASLTEILDLCNRNPKPSLSTINRAAMNLALQGKIARTQQEGGDEGFRKPYAYEMKVMRPRNLRPPVVEAPVEVPVTAAAQGTDILALAAQLFARRTELLGELADIDRTVASWNKAIQKAPTASPRTRRVPSGPRRLGVRRSKVTSKELVAVS